jgi:hypothetical protein
MTTILRNHRLPLLLLGLSLLLLATNSLGCEGKAATYNAFVTYDQALVAAIDARKAGRIDDVTYHRLMIASDAAYAALQVARLRATTQPSGGVAAQEIEAVDKFVYAVTEALR